MIVSNDDVIQREIEFLGEEESISWDQFKDTTILVTGATGLIGSQFVYSLMYANELKKLNIRVLAIARNKDKAIAMFQNFWNCDNFKVCVSDINDAIEIDENIDYIMHGASTTASKDFVEKPVETIMTLVNGTKNILELAKIKKIKKMVFLSSMEVYGVCDKDSILENDYGYLDSIQVRSSYSEGKRLCECLCVSYSKEYGVPVTIARLTQTFGPGVRKEDNRVFAQFAKSVIEKKNIILYSKGETVRNYCFITDALSALLILLQKGNDAEAYNIANPDTTISIIDMARMLADEFSKNEICVEIRLEDNEKHGFNPVSKTCIDSQKMIALGWMPKVGLREAFEKMICSMRRGE